MALPSEYTYVSKNGYHFHKDYNKPLSDRIITDLRNHIGHNQTVNLYFGEKFDQSIDNLPDEIDTIFFGRYFNQKINKYPSQIKRIYFGIHYNQYVDNLPNDLTHLKLGFDFKKSVNHLPPNLVSLETGYSFNEYVDCLPCNLESLILGNNFNRPLDNLPLNLKVLHLIQSKYQDLSDNYFKQSINYLPDSIEVISMECVTLPEITKLPKSLESIELNLQYYEYQDNLNKLLDQLPNLKYKKIKIDNNMKN